MCPDKFVGTVTKVSEPKAPFNSLSKVNVTFQVDQTLAGQPRRAPEIKVLKYGHLKFNRGDSFEIKPLAFEFSRAKHISEFLCPD